MSEHTPGPWEFKPAREDYRRVLSPDINAGGNWHVAIVQSSNADARLIAAAPDLLAACEYALDAMSGPDGPEPTMAEKMAMDRLRAAIEKARGC